MPNPAQTKINVGKGQLDVARTGKGAQFGKMRNTDRLALSEAGIKNLMQGTIEKNRRKKGLDK